MSAAWQQRVGNTALAVALPGTIVVMWEVSTQAGMVSTFLLPPFSAVMARLAEELASGALIRATFNSLYLLVISYTIAVVAGVAIGIMMARIRLVRWFMDPIVSIGFPAPKIAFLPIFVLWLGVFDAPKIAMAAFSCIFPIIGGTWAGTQGGDKYLIWSAESLGTRRHEMLWRIVFPAALPQIFTAMQVALPIAFIVVIVSEMLTAGTGLGGAMIIGARLADSTAVFANLFAIGLLGIAAMRGLQLVRRRVLVWHQEVQHGAVL